MFSQEEGFGPGGKQSPQVVVIGAGFAGLAAATRLAEKGLSPLLIEATAHGGGRARSYVDTPSGREIDNGQHLLMGCYHETLRFLDRIGQREALTRQKKLRVRLCADERNVDLRCPALPAPLHLAAGLLGMRGLAPHHRAQALRVGLALRSEVDRPDDHESCDAWLHRLGQGRAIRKCFWDPLIWATLNDDPLLSSAAMLLAVLERAFLGSAQDSCFAWPKVPLNPFYVQPSLDYLKQRGASLYMSQRVESIEVEKGRIKALQLKKGPRLVADAVIAAIPPHALLPIWPAPKQAGASEYLQKIAALKYSPIVNLWVFLKQSSASLPARIQPFVGALDSPIHWVFDRDAIESQRNRNREALINLTISGAHAFRHQSPAELQSFAQSELARLWPKNVPPPEVSRVLSIQEKRATIRHLVGSYNNRPEAQTPYQGLWLAGDWVRTGLPATIESAVQSGHHAADRLLAELPARRGFEVRSE